MNRPVMENKDSMDEDERRSRAVTVKEVAASAGVSLSTVSNVLNRPDRVAPATLARVQSAINSLGYIRNDAARALRLGQSRAIGFVVTDVTSPFYADVVRAAGEYLAKRNYTMLVGSAYHLEDVSARLVELFEAQRVQGMLINPTGSSQRLLDGMTRRGVPIVHVDATPDWSETCAVTVDHALGGRLAMQHLHALGRDSVALVRGPADLQQINARMLGAKAACEEFGMHYQEVIATTYFTRGGIEAGAVIASRPSPQRPDGIFAANDLLAMGLVTSLTERGVRVPQDIAVIGYDDAEISATAKVPLTTIRQPAVDIGTRAAAILVNEIENGPGHKHEKTIFTPELTVRASTVG